MHRQTTNYWRGEIEKWQKWVCRSEWEKERKNVCEQANKHVIATHTHTHQTNVHMYEIDEWEWEKPLVHKWVQTTIIFNCTLLACVYSWRCAFCFSVVYTYRLTKWRWCRVTHSLLQQYHKTPADWCRKRNENMWYYGKATLNTRNLWKTWPTVRNLYCIVCQWNGFEQRVRVKLYHQSLDKLV